MKRVFVCSHYKRRGGWRAVLMYMCSWHLKRKCPLTTTTTTISTPPTAFTPWCNGWGEGTVSGFPHCGTLWTGVKNSIRTHHNAITVSMPTQPHMGEAYTFHGLWKHGRWIMMGIIELLNPIAVVTVTWGVRVKIRKTWTCVCLSSRLICMETPADPRQAVQLAGYWLWSPAAAPRSDSGWKSTPKTHFLPKDLLCLCDIIMRRFCLHTRRWIFRFWAQAMVLTHKLNSSSFSSFNQFPLEFPRLQLLRGNYWTMMWR